MVLVLESGRLIKSDLLLLSNGRTGNTDGMNLGAIGLKPDGRGQLAANHHYQTAIPHIYAAGDVAGPPALASAGYVQGHHAVQHILDPTVSPHRLDMVPSGIYTLPEISSVGTNERQLREQQLLQRHVQSLETFFNSNEFIEEKMSMNIAGRLEKCRQRLSHVLSPEYLTELHGTLGTDRL